MRLTLWHFMLLIKEAISQASGVPRHGPREEGARREPGDRWPGCVLSERRCYCWEEGCIGGQPCTPPPPPLSVFMSHALPPLSGTKPRRTLGAGAAHFDAWLSLYHCLVT